MIKNKRFDCVDNQRKIRSMMIKEANYDLNKLAEIINDRTKNNKILLKYNKRKKIQTVNT